MIRANDIIEAKEQVIKHFETRLKMLNNEIDEVAFQCRNTKQELGKIKDSDSERYQLVAFQMVQADLEFECLKELYNKMLDAFNNCISRRQYDFSSCSNFGRNYNTGDEDYF